MQIMQKSDSGILYSASDFADFLVCRHMVNLKRINLDAPLQKAETDEQTKLLQNTCGNRGGDGRSFSRFRSGGGHCVDDNIEW